MRRSAAAFVRRWRLELPIIMAVVAGALIGLAAGALFQRLTGASPGGAWALGAVLVGAAVLLLSIRSLERRRPGNPERGETNARRAIEHALSAPDCAAGHAVTSIARIGEVDHLVATPVRLWVIEARDRPVPREQFPEVLQRLADNTTAVWQWAPAGTPVRGCLVLASDPPTRRKTFDYGKEPIVVHTPASLARELKSEARTERVLDDRSRPASANSPGSGSSRSEHAAPAISASASGVSCATERSPPATSALPGPRCAPMSAPGRTPSHAAGLPCRLTRLPAGEPPWHPATPPHSTSSSSPIC